MKLRLCICMLIVLFISVVAFYTDSKIKEGELNASVPASSAGEQTEQIKEITYNKNGISGSYPNFITGRSEDAVKKWNKIIEEDFQKILEIYSFTPILGPTPTAETQIPVILNINHTIKLNSNNIVSVFYKAAYNSPYSAHPTELVYTTNIDKNKNTRLRLSDVVRLDEEFVKNFRTWDFKSVEENNPEINQAVKDYLASISDEDLLAGLIAADQINSKNLWDIYSYYTPEKLGISLGVPNYIGDHVEFERSYEELKDFIKPEYQKTIISNHKS